MLRRGCRFWGSKEIWNARWSRLGSRRSQRVALEQYVQGQFHALRRLQLPEAPPPPAGPPTGGPRRRAQDLISQTIMTQVGALLKSNASNGPFGGMTVRYLVMGGASQQAARRFATSRIRTPGQCSQTAVHL